MRKIIAVCNERRNGSATCDDLEVGKLHFERHRPTPHSCRLAMPPNLVDQRLELGDHRIEVFQVGDKRVFGADGFADLVGTDRAVVDTARDPVVVGAGFAEVSCRKARDWLRMSRPVQIPKALNLAAVADPTS